MKKGLLLFVFRLILGGVFLYAGITKVLDPGGFALSIYNYRLLPGWAVNAAAIVLPWLEMVAGASLLAVVAVAGASLIVSSLLATFAVALASALARGLDIACGCFSTSGTSAIDWSYLGRDLGLLAMALAVLFFDRGRFSLAGLFRKTN